MNSAGPLIVFLSALVWGAIHSLLAALGFKRWISRNTSPRSQRFYRLVYNAFAAISLLPVLGVLARFPGKLLYTIPLPWSILTTLIQLAAVLLVAIGISQTGAGEFLGLRQLDRSSRLEAQLITTGPYAFVRHPLYTCGLAFIWLSPFMTTSLLALNIAFTLYIVVGAKLEERKLQAEFGEAYTTYRQHTPMFIPFAPF